MPELDRKTLICQQTTPMVTGIDFVQVVDHTAQDVLHIFFLIAPLLVDGGGAFPNATAGTTMTDSERAALSITAPETGDVVEIVDAVWMEVTSNGVVRKALEVRVDEPGGFELYRFRFEDPAMDRFFDHAIFSFKQGCPSGADCAVICACPDPVHQDVTIDYLARDYGSLRAALLDFAAAHYPEWEARIAADPGMMMLEIMAALGDDFAYQQDRLATEAYLETATQTQSVVNLARLVDYKMDKGDAATTLLIFGVHTKRWTKEVLTASPDRVLALREDLGAVPFEPTEKIWLHPDWNEKPLYLPDAGTPCLPIGATEAFVDVTLPVPRQLPGGVVFANPEDIWIGRKIVLRSGQTDPANPKRAFAVKVTSVTGYTDPLNPAAAEIAHLTWEEPLSFEMPIADAKAYFNVVPAIAGRTVTELFRVGDDAALALAYSGVDAVQMSLLTALSEATEREGACSGGSRGVVVRHGLTGSDELGVSWYTVDGEPEPRMVLSELTPDLGIAETVDFNPAQTWKFELSILDAAAESPAFTLEHGMWTEAVRFRKPSGDVVLRDYVGNDGFSIRFGDRNFGASPADGAVFEARYLTAPGRSAHLAADAITKIEAPEGSKDKVTNPFAVVDARPAETLDRIRMNAPEAFRAILLRAGRNEDYRTILERRNTIQQANAVTRWTGSWLTDFVAVDPAGTQVLDPYLRADVVAELDCVRQAARQVCLRDADYVPIDVEVDVWLEPAVSNAAMVRRITEALNQFFDPDNFTFGTLLIRSALEAAVQCVGGVRGVEAILVRRRGKADFEPMPPRLLAAPHEILQLANDPARPERGFLEVSAHGGG